MAAHPGHRGDRYEPIKRLALVQIQPPRNPNKPLTPFSIQDILSQSRSHAHNNKLDNDGPSDARSTLSFIRPWADSPPPRSSTSSSEFDEDEEIQVEDDPPKVFGPHDSSPLDALLQMTSKTFEGLDAHQTNADGKWSFKITLIIYVYTSI